MKTRRRRIGIEILFERTEERDGVRETRPVVTAAFPDPFFPLSFLSSSSSSLFRLSPLSAAGRGVNGA